MFIRIPNVQFSTSPRMTPNPCYKLPFSLLLFCVVEFEVSLCGWADIHFCKLWLVRQLVRLAKVYGCEGQVLIRSSIDCLIDLINTFLSSFKLFASLIFSVIKSIFILSISGITNNDSLLDMVGRVD